MHPRPVVWALAAVLLAGCASQDAPSAAEDPAPSTDVRPSPSAAPTQAHPSRPARPRDPSPERTRPVEEAPPQEPRRSFLTVPALGLDAVPVVRYPGTPDDAPGTRIQDSGPAASPRGPGGGVGPGEVGNFLVTAHRTSHTAPFRDLPALRPGARVLVRSGSTVFVYRVTTTRSTSFRSPRSLAEQSAAVPGRPGAVPVRPVITLSTCATPEDHAAGNYWSDELGNPEHRIEKIGVLVEERPAPA